MPQNKQSIGYAIYLSFLMVGLASISAVATKTASATVATEVIVSVQFSIGLLLCLPSTLRGGLRSLHTERLGLHAVRGIAGVLGFYLFYLSLDKIPMVDAMLLRQSAPLTVPLVMWLWEKQATPRSAWGPLIIGFAGIAIILRPSTDGLSGWHAAGLASALALAISMVATRRLASTEPAQRILLYYFLLSLLCLLPFSLGQLGGLTPRDWALMLFIGVTMYGCLYLYTRAYAIAPASVIAPINYFAVVLAAFWGWFFWDQVPDAASLLGSALVICGGLLTIYLAQRASKSV